MPPPAVKTVRDQIFWQYAKIIADSAGVGSGIFAFVMNRFKKLQGGEIEWAGSIREYVKERELPKACIYCGKKRNLGKVPKAFFPYFICPAAQFLGRPLWRRGSSEKEDFSDV